MVLVTLIVSLLCWWDRMGTPLLTTPRIGTIRQWSHCFPPNKRSAWELTRFHSSSHKCSLDYHGRCNLAACCCSESDGLVTKYTISYAMLHPTRKEVRSTEHQFHAIKYINTRMQRRPIAENNNNSEPCETVT